MDEKDKKSSDSTKEDSIPEVEFKVVDVQPKLLKITSAPSDVSSTVSAPVSAPLKGLSWPSSSWTDGTHRSAFQPYRVCSLLKYFFI